MELLICIHAFLIAYMYLLYLYIYCICCCMLANLFVILQPQWKMPFDHLVAHWEMHVTHSIASKYRNINKFNNDKTYKISKH